MPKTETRPDFPVETGKEHLLKLPKSNNTPSVQILVSNFVLQ